MKTHSQEGYALLARSRSRIHSVGAQIALEHHERWDGTGYPAGHKGGHISLNGRIAAVADVLDSLVSASCYKEAWPLQTALDYLTAESGKHFDPDLVAAIHTNRQAIEKIYSS
jgi:response regulator RpfG family c-di-GMP phosphodiesterase